LDSFQQLSVWNVVLLVFLGAVLYDQCKFVFGTDSLLRDNRQCAIEEPLTQRILAN
jgi:hypothetical protein